MTFKFQQLRSFGKLFLYTLVAPIVLIVAFLSFGEADLPPPPDWAYWIGIGLLAAVWLASVPAAPSFWKAERRYSNPVYTVDLRLEGTVKEIEPDSFRSLAKKAMQLEAVKASSLSILVTDDDGFRDRDRSSSFGDAAEGVLSVVNEEARPPGSFGASHWVPSATW